MLAVQPSGGVCELHGSYEPTVNLISIPQIKISNLAPLGATEESILANPMVVCNKCRTVVAALSGTILRPVAPVEETMPDDVLDKSNVYPLLEKFFHIQDVFHEIIDGIYLVPLEEVAGTRFADKPLNVVVGLRNFNIQSYTAWTVRNHKSASHLWNIPSDRGKFWSVKTMRILLALGKLHLSSTQFNVWIATYTRVVSIEYFCTTPPRMVQLQPSKLYKVK